MVVQAAAAASNNSRASKASSNSRATKAASKPADTSLALAFLGDAIWSLCVRRHFLNPPKHHSLYQSSVRPYVTAEGQAALFDHLLSGSSGSSSGDSSSSSSSQLVLTPSEAALLRRISAWQAGKLRKRFDSPAAAEAYRKATALEALVGHLHLTDPARLELLVATLLPQPAQPAGTPASSSPASLQQTVDEEQQKTSDGG